MFLELAILCMTVALALYSYLVSYYKFWDKFDIPIIRPKYPLFGNNFETLLSLKPRYFAQWELYNKYPDAKLIGSFQYMTPNLIVKDPDLIETITIKDFAYVTDRGGATDPRATKLSDHLFNRTGTNWKSLRNKLTPIYSSLKLKNMFRQVMDCGDSLISNLKTHESGKPVDASEMSARFAIDVISSCAFGMSTDAINDPNNPLRTVAKQCTGQYTVFRKIKEAIRIQRGLITRLITIPLVSPEVRKFFSDMINTNLKQRQTQSIVRQDFLHLMNELRIRDEETIKKGRLDPNDPSVFTHWSLLSNSFLFFLAGYDTTSNPIGYGIYELALNQDVQEKLYREVLAGVEKDGEMTYDTIMNLDYLEQFTSEVLRHYSPVPEVTRLVTTEYHVPGTDAVLPPGTIITLPIYSIHHDPQYYSEPDKFLPERFSGNKEMIKKGSFIPFGHGPRMCIAARFALMELKIAYSKILLNYKIVKTDKTKVPIKFDKRTILTVPYGGIWVGFEPRHVLSHNIVNK